MRRMVVLLSVVAMMVVMMAMSVAPAFAATPTFICTNPDTGESLASTPSMGSLHFLRSHGYTDCVRFRS
jgi:hypothetical protein